MNQIINSISLHKNNPIPLYRQIYQQLRVAILSGSLPPGSRLPAVKKIAAQLGVALVTVTQALDQLAAEGFLLRRVGAGTFVRADLSLDLLPATDVSHPPFVFQPRRSKWGQLLPQRPLPQLSQPRQSGQPRPEIDFGFGRTFAHSFPYDIWRRLLARYLSTDDAMLSRYGSVAGFFPLRQALADYLTRWRGMSCTAQQVVIVNGAQQALDILCRLWLPAGEEVLVETPGYVEAFTLFQAHGAAICPLVVDDQGFPVEQIPPDSEARMVFVTPSNQFPKGGTLPAARRLALLAWARRQGALIIEDDYDGELRYDGRPLTTLQSLDNDGRVIYLGNFSKVLFPALRLSYVVLPPQLVASFLQVKTLIDRGAPTLTQAAVADFMTEGHFERHLRHLRMTYGRRQRVLISALQERFGEQARYTAEPAGLHIMLYLPPQTDEVALVRRALGAGVGVYGGAAYHLQPTPPPSVLLGFSGVSEGDIVEGVRRLAQVYKNDVT